MIPAAYCHTYSSLCRIILNGDFRCLLEPLFAFREKLKKPTGLFILCLEFVRFVSAMGASKSSTRRKGIKFEVLDFIIWVHHFVRILNIMVYC